ncbi:MAG: DUF192 domain-containing protein [Halobacteriota archaeon]
MVSRRTLLAIAIVGIGVVVAGGAIAYDLGFLVGDYEWTTVEIADGDSGESLATIDVRIADTTAKRYTGLSDTESLDPDEGMLFVHDDPGEYSYVMREMDFPIDIIFVDENGRITQIYSAHVEDDSDLTRYTGEGQYVLEVNEGYADEHGIEAGDRLRFDLDDTRNNR